MKLIKPYFEILEQKPRNIIIPSDMEIGPKMVRQELIDTVYRQIEIAGRTCYKSEDKITPDSAAKFVERMVKSGHGAMLEHGTVYLFLPMSSRQQYFKYCSNPYSVANSTGEAEKGTWNGFVTTNYRVLVENGWLDDLEYICNPSKYLKSEQSSGVVGLVSRKIRNLKTNRKWEERYMLFEEILSNERKEALEEGQNLGEERMGELIDILARQERYEDLKKAAKDKVYLHKLFREFNL